MNNFCEKCNNLLKASTANNKLSFTCMVCHSMYPAKDDDTLRYKETKSSNLHIYQTILKKASKDPANIKTKFKCPKCKNNIAKSVRLGSELRLINVCEGCDSQFFGL